MPAARRHQFAVSRQLSVCSLAAEGGIKHPIGHLQGVPVTFSVSAAVPAPQQYMLGAIK